MSEERIDSTNINYDKLPEYAKKLDSIFQYNRDINKTAYMNWRTGFADGSRKQFIIIGESFFTSAYHLIKECLDDNSDKKADSWIFPILFNVVHGMELYLKAIDSALSAILEKKRGITEGGHDLKTLCGTARNLVIEYKNLHKDNTSEQMFTAIKVVERFIDNIYAKTNDMTFARYPMAKDKNGQFYIQNLENEVVDLVLLQNQVSMVYHMLELIYDMPTLEIEMNAEAMKDFYY